MILPLTVLFFSLFSLTISAPSTPFNRPRQLPTFNKRQSGGTINVTELILELNEAPTANARDALLVSSGASFIFDFLGAESFAGGGKDGGVVLADDTLWPATDKNNGAWLMGFLGPCGMVAPHSHPRATEILVNLGGPPMNYGNINEGGAIIATGEMGVGTVVVLPMNSIHFVQNSGCYPVFLGAFFNNQSPGALFVSQMYAAFDQETIEAAFGIEGVVTLSADKIPNAVNVGRQECLKTCGLSADFDFSSKSKIEIMHEAMAGYLKDQGYTPKSKRK